MPVIRNIHDRVLQVGALDHNLPYFDRLMPTPYGTTYNSFVLLGDERTALIDPVQSDCIDQLLENLSAAGVDHLDDIICLHTEQDHSGSIHIMRAQFPDARLVATAKVAEFMEVHLHLPRESFHIVGDGDVIDLGGISLVCCPIPFAHWPDNTMYWFKEERILFSSDLFGSHYAPDVPSHPCTSLALKEARAYYSEIMMPGRNHVIRHLKRVRELDPLMICSAHGPIWKDPSLILDLYETMTSNKVRREVVIAYVTMHESTRRMVDIVAETLVEEGISVHLFDLGDPNRDLRVSAGSAVTATVNTSTLLLASPTVLGGPHPAASLLAGMLNVFNPNLRYLGIMGSFGWGSQMVKQLDGILSRQKAERLEPLLVRGLPTEEDRDTLRTYALDLSSKIKAIPQDEIIEFD